jgi:hypothetical protein
VSAGHRPAGESDKGFAVALEQDRLVAVDQVEPLLTVVGMGAVEEAPVDRVRARPTDPDVRVREQDLAWQAEQRVAQQRVGQDAVGREPVDHVGPPTARRGRTASAAPR